MPRPSYRVPAHALVEGAYHFNLLAVRLRIPKGPLAAVLALAGLPLLPGIVFFQAWWFVWLPLAVGLSLVGGVLVSTPVEGLRLHRWLVVWARYRWGRPRRLVWQPAHLSLPMPTAPAWVRYRLTGPRPGVPRPIQPARPPAGEARP